MRVMFGGVPGVAVNMRNCEREHDTSTVHGDAVERKAGDRR